MSAVNGEDPTWLKQARAIESSLGLRHRMATGDPSQVPAKEAAGVER